MQVLAWQITTVELQEYNVAGVLNVNIFAV
jgi:hypothetical protein